MQTEILHADKSLRNTAVVWLILFSVVMMACYYYVFGGLQEIIADGSDAEVLERLQRVRWLTLGLVMVSVVSAVYFLYMGGKVLQSARFPPPGMRVVRDTPVRTGTTARIIGLLVICVSLALIVASVWVHFLMLRLMASLPP